MSYRLKLTVLTMIAGFATAFPGCSDDDSNGDDGNEAGEGPTATGGKASTGGSTSKGGSTSSGGSTDPGDAGEGAGGADTPSTGGAPAEAGAPGEGGTPGEAGATGSGGAPAGTCEAPACLEDLTANCAPEGACTQAIGIDIMNPTAPPNVAICWENGVKAGMTDLDIETFSGTMEFQNANGTPCYHLELQFDADGNTTGVYKTVMGDTVATMVVDNEAETNTVSCVGGETYVYSPGSCDEGPAVPDQDSCMTGACELE